MLVLFAVLAILWFSRERLAEDFITWQLEKLGVDARYDIESIGPTKQVLTNLEVGDPARPDLTIERIEVFIEPRWPLVGIGRLRLVEPRLYGSYQGGKLSFGALDKLLFEGEETAEPFKLPDLVLDLEDARALLETDYGPVGAKAEGEGNLRGGFSGVLAAIAPELATDGCRAAGASIFGEVKIRFGQPEFAGPLRVKEFACDNGLAAGQLGVELQARMDADLKGVEGDAGLASGEIAYIGSKAREASGEAKFTWRQNGLTASYQAAFEGIAAPQLAIDRLKLDGAVRARDSFERLEVETNAEAEAIRPGAALDQALAQGGTAAKDTLFGPMLTRIRSALVRESRNSSFRAELTLRKTNEIYSIVMPQARMRGASGDTLLALSRVQVALRPDAAPRFSGNFTTGGRDLPVISGRMEGRDASNAVLRLSMAEYRAGNGRLAIPRLMVTQGPDGAIGFAGEARASGPIPGGEAQGLVVPIRGGWSRGGGLAVWRQCTPIRFDRLVLSNLALDRRNLTLCPPTGSSIVRSGPAGMRIAAGVPSLDLTGILGETPIGIRTGAVGFAWPGNLTAREVEVRLGPPDAPTRFSLSQVDARIGGEFGGTFAGTEAYLAAVPLDVLDAAGSWRFADGRLILEGGNFVLRDRQQPGRFEPLAARDATLLLADNRITAAALLREPRSDRAVVQANIFHDLASGAGHADLGVPGIVFDQQLQPEALSGLTLGLIANASGTITGNGRIEWDAEKVTSRGRFSTSGFDFAAAFGPVEGVSGTIEFTDLLGMVTAPDQKLAIRAFNPGIQVDSGEIRFAIRPDYLMQVNGGRWPFIGGALVLEPAEIHMAEAEKRRFVLRLEGVDAAQFVERMELANISATGTFDGRVPLVFDENGGRIEGGRLRSRPPGGNLSYVGKLSYEDMSAMANFAFDALKSLDYNQMDIDLDGSLTGEIVTKVRFDGIRQGAGTSQNIVTRQLARLPLRFNVNIHAPFYQLIGSFKSMYDPSAMRDPRTMGADFPFPPPGQIVDPQPPAIKPKDMPEDEVDIQPPESETVP